MYFNEILSSVNMNSEDCSGDFSSSGNIPEVNEKLYISLSSDAITGFASFSRLIGIP
jgi:hypothetical protein